MTRQPAGHRLDQDDPERLRRLGGEQEEVGGSQHVGQLAVRDRAEEVDALAHAGGRRLGAEAVEQLAAAGDDQVDVAALRPRGDPRQRLDRHVEPLEVVGAVEGRRRRRRPARRPAIPSRSRRPAPFGPGENSSVSTPFGISISFSGRARRSGEGRGPSSRGRPTARRSGPPRGPEAARPCARRPRTAARAAPLPTSRFL